MAEIWRIELFGGLRLQRAGAAPLDLGNRKSDALLARAAFFCRERALTRDELAGWLWSREEDDEKDKRGLLRRALMDASRLLEPEGVAAGSVVIADKHTIRLNPEAVSTDVGDFERALLNAARTPDPAARATILSGSTELFARPLLPGARENWTPERHRLATDFFRELDKLARMLEEMDDPGEAIHCTQDVIDCACDAAVREKPPQQRWHCVVMRLCLLTDRRDAGLRVYKQIQGTLKEEFGLKAEPSLEAQALARELRKPKTVIGGGGIDRARPVGVLSPRSLFHIQRKPAEDQLREAIRRRDSIVLVKGPRGIGKSTLLARWIDSVRKAGPQVVHTDLKNPRVQMGSGSELCLTLARDMAKQLELDTSPDAVWDRLQGCLGNLEEYLEEQVLGKVPGPLVWVLDGVDRLFDPSSSPEVLDLFPLFRAFHNLRATEPSAHWARLTLVLVHSVEPSLLIKDPRLSPFNVATPVLLEDDFTPNQVGILNRRHESPLRTAADIERFFGWLGGVPHLVNYGLYALANGECSLPQILELDAKGPLHESLKRLLDPLCDNPELAEALRAVLRDEGCPTEASFYRLGSAGVVTGESAREARFRCELYRRYVERRLSRPSPPTPATNGGDGEQEETPPEDEQPE
jgi:DNA-binding SARP family transcriptional activator